MTFASVESSLQARLPLLSGYVTIRLLILMAIFVSSLLLSLKNGLKALQKCLRLFLSSSDFWA